MVLREDAHICVVEQGIREHNLESIYEHIRNARQKRLIIGNGFEPVSKELIYRIYDYAVSLNKFSKIAACTCNTEGNWEIPHIFSANWLMPMKFNHLNVTKDCHVKNKLYHCINRTPRKHRTETILQLRNRGLEKLGYISYAGGLDFANENLDPSDVIPDYPLVLDKADITPRDILGITGWSGNKIYQIIKDSLFGVICETLFDPTWNTKQYSAEFVSEKTISCFCLFQVPIIVGQLDSVEWCKQHGFDMFDDYIDHSYDSEPNPNLRIDKAINQLDNLRDVNPQDFFYKHKNRFYHNTNQVESIWRYYHFQSQYHLDNFKK